MDKQTYDALTDLRDAPILVKASDFTGPDRTLLYGYTVVRDTFHVYLQDGKIHKVIYDIREELLSHEARESWHAEDLVPDKRAYPERTDGHFAGLMHRHGVTVYYTRFDEELYETAKDKLFHGLIVE